MADEARAQRLQALDEKKKKLEAMRAKKSQREGSSGVTARAAAQERIKASANLDTYIDGLLKQPSAAPAGSSDAYSSTIGAPPSDSNGLPNNVVGVPAAATSSTTAPSPSQPAAVAPVALAPPPPKEVFEMSTQTAEDDFPPTDDDDDKLNLSDVDESSPDGDNTATNRDGDDVLHPSTSPEEEQAKVLTADELEKELASEDFSHFLNAASKKVERVLGSAMLADLLTEYDDKTDNPSQSQQQQDGSKYISSRQIYECPQWTATRDVTDMDWSPLHRELMLCCYHMPTSTSSTNKGSTAVQAVSPDDTPSDSMAPRPGELQSDGLALVWNLAMPDRPEHIFTCGSPVTSVQFHPTESYLIIGGCQSGQVVVWDVRAGRMPVQKSSLTTTSGKISKGHVHPICAMEIIEGGAGLVTGATDGRINFWSFANLRDPVESLQIGESVSCLGVSPESETLVCGDEMGNLYAIASNQATLSSTGQRSRRQVRKLDPGDAGHFGMITSLSTKTVKSSARAGLTKGFLRGSGGLFLTTGVDWTVKMWGPAYTDKTLLSLVSHSYDYMSDVQWNPTHPSLMATASSNGSIGIWNFAETVEEPVTGSEGIVVEPDGSSGRGLNKLKWSSDGRRMLVASADRVHVLVVSEEVVRQKGDEEARMMNHLTSRGLLLDRE